MNTFDSHIGVNCVDDEGGQNSVGLLRNLSKDDLRFELRRLQQRCDVLERDKHILEEEAELAATRPGQADRAVLDSLTAEIERKSEALRHAEEARVALGQRHRVVLRHLWLETRALREMKSELQSGLRDINSMCTLVSRRVRAEGEAAAGERAAAGEAWLGLRGRLAAALPEVQMQMKDMKFELAKWKANTILQFSNMNVMVGDIVTGMGHEWHQQQERDLAERKAVEAKLHEKEIAEAALTERVRELQNEIKELRNSTAASASVHSSEVASLRQEIDQLRDKTGRAERESAELQEENLKKDKDINKLKSEICSLQKLYETAQREYTVASISERNLRADVEASQSHAGEAASKLREMTSKREEMKLIYSRNLDEMNITVEQTRSRLSESELEALRLGAALAARTDELGSLQSQLESLKKLTAHQDEKIMELKTQLQNVDRFESRITELETSLRDACSRYDALESNFDEAESLALQQRRDRDELQAKLSSKEVESSRLQKDFEDLRSQHALSSNEVMRLTKVVERECQERTEMLIHISELQDNIKYLSSKEGDLPLRQSVSKSIPSSVLSLGAGPEASSSSSSSSVLDRKRPAGLVDALAFRRGAAPPEGSQKEKDDGTIGAGRSSRETEEEEAPGVDAAWTQMRAAHKGPGKNRRLSRHG